MKKLILVYILVILFGCEKKEAPVPVNYSEKFKVISLTNCEKLEIVKIMKGRYGNDLTNKLCQCSYERVVNTLSDEDKKYIVNGGKGLYVDPIISKFENDIVDSLTSCMKATIEALK
jgi:hypothetical protein